ncbi:unknown [Clostridium sp. CAG:524]|nr:unknown [Clostridium sp. CAG:524]
MFYYTFKNKNGINKLKSIINKIIDEKVSKITITDSKNEIPKDVVITILIK